MRNPQRTSTVVSGATPRSHIIHSEEWGGGGVRTGTRVLAAPESPARSPRANNNSIPKPWQARVHRSLHVNTPHPITLHAFRLVGVEHGVVAVSVIREDGVVPSQPFHDHHSTPTEDGGE